MWLTDRVKDKGDYLYAVAEKILLVNFLATFTSSKVSYLSCCCCKVMYDDRFDPFVSIIDYRV